MFARTERLLLRPSWPEDAEALHQAIADEAIIRNLSTAPWPYRLDDAHNFVRMERPVHYPNFLIFRRTDGAPCLIGSCGFADLNGQTELGYWIARPYWGLGYASEAAGAVVGIAKALGHKYLVAGHFVDNPASGNVLRKTGFRHTGRTAMRHSKGRGQNAPCILFERSLDDEAGGGDIAMAMANSPPQKCPLPYDVELIAA